MGIVASPAGVTIDFSDITPTKSNTATPLGGIDSSVEPNGIATYSNYALHSLIFSYIILSSAGAVLKGGSYNYLQVTADDPLSSIFNSYATTLTEQNYIMVSGSPVTQASSLNLFDPPVIDSITTESRTVTYTLGAIHILPTHTKTNSVEMLSAASLAARAALVLGLDASQTLRINVGTHYSLYGSYDIHSGQFIYGSTIYATNWATAITDFPVTDLGVEESLWTSTDVELISPAVENVAVASVTQECVDLASTTRTEI